MVIFYDFTEHYLEPVSGNFAHRDSHYREAVSIRDSFSRLPKSQNLYILMKLEETLDTLNGRVDDAYDLRNDLADIFKKPIRFGIERLKNSLHDSDHTDFSDKQIEIIMEIMSLAEKSGEETSPIQLICFPIKAFVNFIRLLNFRDYLATIEEMERSGVERTLLETLIYAMGVIDYTMGVVGNEVLEEITQLIVSLLEWGSAGSGFTYRELPILFLRTTIEISRNKERMESFGERILAAFDDCTDLAVDQLPYSDFISLRYNYIRNATGSFEDNSPLVAPLHDMFVTFEHFSRAAPRCFKKNRHVNRLHVVHALNSCLKLAVESNDVEFIVKGELSSKLLKIKHLDSLRSRLDNILDVGECIVDVARSLENSYMFRLGLSASQNNSTDDLPSSRLLELDIIESIHAVVDDVFDNANSLYSFDVSETDSRVSNGEPLSKCNSQATPSHHTIDELPSSRLQPLGNIEGTIDRMQSADDSILDNANSPCSLDFDETSRSFASEEIFPNDGSEANSSHPLIPVDVCGSEMVSLDLSSDQPGFPLCTSSQVAIPSSLMDTYLPMNISCSRSLPVCNLSNSSLSKCKPGTPLEVLLAILKEKERLKPYDYITLVTQCYKNWNEIKMLEALRRPLSEASIRSFEELFTSVADCFGVSLPELPVIYLSGADHQTMGHWVMFHRMREKNGSHKVLLFDSMYSGDFSTDEFEGRPPYNYQPPDDVLRAIANHYPSAVENGDKLVVYLVPCHQQANDVDCGRFMQACYIQLLIYAMTGDYKQFPSQVMFHAAKMGTHVLSLVLFDLMSSFCGREKFREVFSIFEMAELLKFPSEPHDYGDWRLYRKEYDVCEHSEN